MSNRPHKDVSDKYLAKLRERFNQIAYSPETPDSFNHKCQTMLNNLHTHLTIHKGELEDIKNRKSSTNRGWETNLADVQQQYRQIHSLYEFMKNEETAIKRIENQAHRRALLYRILTTLGIGFGIMFVYFVAQELSINMPLLKVR